MTAVAPEQLRANPFGLCNDRRNTAGSWNKKSIILYIPHQKKLRSPTNEDDRNEQISNEGIWLTRH